MFHYDPVHRVVIKEDIPQLSVEEEEEMRRQQLAARESRRKRPRYGYGTYEDPFPESDEEQEEVLQASSTRKNPAPTPELPFNHPAIQKEKNRVLDN